VRRDRPRLSRRAGAVLLEVIVALSVLAFVGVAAVTLAAEAARSVAGARRAEAETRAANALFDAVSLWPRSDLDRHLGTTRQGEWRMRVNRSSPVLYDVTLTDSAASRVLLRTTLFREVNRADR